MPSNEPGTGRVATSGAARPLFLSFCGDPIVNQSEPQAGPGARACLLVLVALALALTPLACGGSGPEMARVTGKVTYKSRPVMKGLVTFVATNPNRRNATGQLDPNGGYRLQTE